MTEMSSKLILITPEILLFIGAVVVAVLGLSSHRRVRHAVPWTTVGFLVAAIVATNVVYDGSETVTRRRPAAPESRAVPQGDGRV